MGDAAPSAYPVNPTPPSFTFIGEDRTTGASTSTTSTARTTASSESTASAASTRTLTPTSSAVSSTTASSSIAPSAPKPSAYYHMINASSIELVSKNQLLSAPFEELCPSGNCIEACKNFTRVFEGVPEGFNVDPSQYGRHKGNVTLFETCSNLQYMTTISDSVVKDYFLTNDTQNDVAMITSRMTTCFATTCEQSRNSSLCSDECSATSLLASPSVFDYGNGLRPCVFKLCENTCALPYVDQDVLGVGVLISYFIQAAVLILCAAAFVTSAGVQLWKRPESEPRVKRALRTPLETFLRVQTFFGISLAVATFIMNPAEIDPSNGYALIMTAVMGFLPPVFTMMLLHSHGVRSRFSTILVFISYLVNSITFFMLVRNLSTRPYNRASLDEAINDIFNSDSCGGRSAISLCYQLTGSDPLEFLSSFYNASSFANIKTVPLLWVWTTMVLLLLITRQLVALTGRKAKRNVATLPKVTSQQRDGGALAALFKTLGSPIFTFSTLLLATVVFSLALGYQYMLVKTNDLMDVIDLDGWSFGQVVALLFWAPPLLDIFRAFYDERQVSKETSKTEYAEVQQS